MGSVDIVREGFDGFAEPRREATPLLGQSWHLGVMLEVTQKWIRGAMPQYSIEFIVFVSPTT